MTATGRGVEHLHALYRPDRYSLEIELERSGNAKAKHLDARRREATHRKTNPTTRNTSRGSRQCHNRSI